MPFVWVWGETPVRRNKCMDWASTKKVLRLKAQLRLSGFEHFRKRKFELAADQQGADAEVRRIGGQRDRGRARNGRWRRRRRFDSRERDGVLRPLRLLRQVLPRRRRLHLLRLAAVKRKRHCVTPNVMPLEPQWKRMIFRWKIDSQLAVRLMWRLTPIESVTDDNEVWRAMTNVWRRQLLSLLSFIAMSTTTTTTTTTTKVFERSEKFDDFVIKFDRTFRCREIFPIPPRLETGAKIKFFGTENFSEEIFSPNFCSDADSAKV